MWQESVLRGYCLTLRLYPVGYQTQFGAEMQAVFSLALQEAAEQGGWEIIRLCGRELRDLPLAILRQHWDRKRMEMSTMGTNEMTDRGKGAANQAGLADLPVRSTPWEIIAALLPLIAWGTAWILDAARDIFPVFSRPEFIIQVYLVAHLITLLGLGVGWWMKFPRWSYLYAGLAVAFSAYWAGLAINGWRILGVNFYIPQTDWGWRAWVPLLGLAAVMLGLTRSLDPLKRFFGQVWTDWSNLSLVFYGWLAFLLITILLDGIELPYEFAQPVWMVLAFLGGVVLYLRAAQPWGRALGLDLGLFSAVAGSILLGQIFYPDVSRFASLSDVPAADRLVYIIFMGGWVLVWLGLVFLPALVKLVRFPGKRVPA